MATAVTKFPADGGFSKTHYQDMLNNLQTMINLGMITTASTVAELQTACTGQVNNDDPRS
jgi:hypothetical protein